MLMSSMMRRLYPVKKLVNGLTSAIPQFRFSKLVTS
jgi:hypothetical protein